MSNRYSKNRNEASKGYANPQRQKFVPKTPNTISTKQRTATQTLSNSLRRSDSGTVTSSSATTSRVQMRPSNDLVPNKSGNFVNFLPHDEAVAAGLGADEGGLDPVESQRVVDLLNKQLSRLLKLSPRDFWREVASDTSLHAFLESFLKYRSRWYDFPYHGATGTVAGIIVGDYELSRHGAAGTVAGIIVGDYELSRRVFMVLYRISSNRDPGVRAAGCLSPKDHAVLLQEKKLLDLPKLLDICAIYGHENEELIRLLVANSMNSQPWIHDNFVAVVAHFLNIANTMYQRCTSSLEVLLTSHESRDHSSSCLHVDYLEVMDFLNDAIVSMDAFLGSYKPAAIFFSCPIEMSYGNEELINTLARLHDSLLPLLQRGFEVLFAPDEGVHDKSGDLVSNVVISFNMLSTRIVNFGWKLLCLCYLSDEVYETEFRIPAASKMFPSKVEDPLIRAEIIVQTFKEINDSFSDNPEGKRRQTFLQHIEEKHKLLDRIDLLIKRGWILMDDEQLQLVASIISHPLQGGIQNFLHVPNHATNDRLPMDEESTIFESKVSQIKEIFPNYGKGFISACLEAYNENPEEVIQRILEETLHKDLQFLDTSLEIGPKASSLSIRDDKRKGKLIDHSAIVTSSDMSVGKQPVGRTQASSPSSSAVGRYVRKSTTDLLDSQTLDSKDEKDLGKTIALVSQLEYEDEYDDSFDDLGFSVTDSGYEDPELLDDKLNSSMEKPREMVITNSAPNASKWGSRRKPQYFVKDGKNYSYKVAGSVAVANYDEAASFNQAQKNSIHGLGRGGNVPFGGFTKYTESNESNEDEELIDLDVDGEVKSKGSQRGRGRRGGGRNHSRRGLAMRKHFSGLTRY